MTEEEARDWIAAEYGGERFARVARFVALLLAENERHNLIARSTTGQVWSRHIADSAQLARFSNDQGLWLDVGSGGGLPGLVLALLLDRPFVLCEPRALRASFLVRAADDLGLSAQVTVAQRRVEVLRVAARTITARAVASIDAVLSSARHCADAGTTWILPRGQSAADDIERSTMLIPPMFHVEPSLTDPRAAIVVARGYGR